MYNIIIYKSRYEGAAMRQARRENGKQFPVRSFKHLTRVSLQISF